MPEIKLRGLRGLDGLSSLTPEEQYSFMSAHADQLNAYRNPRQRKQAANILYMNQKFINTFDEDAFNKMNDGSEDAFNMRNALVKNKVALDAFQQKFGRIDTPEGRAKHPFTTEVASQLDAQGMIDLINNQEYMGPIVRQKEYNKYLDAAKKVGKSYDKSINNSYVDALGAGYMIAGKTKAALTPSQIDAKNKKRDDEILNKLYAETQERREKESQKDIDMVFANMLNLDDKGQKSLAQSYKEFDKLATQNSNYYKTFKNSKWMKNYSNEDRLKDYAKFLVLKQKYGETVALKYLEQSMQNRVADAQDGKWTGNTLKGVLTTTWSDLGSNVALFANIGKSAEEMAILNQGKDPNKPIYDKKGNIVDYQRNEGWITNPAYWNNVYKYNTFSPTEIKAIEERGGISGDVNVRQFGYTPDFLSWDTAEEGFKQSGHIGAGIIETALTGTAGKLVGWAGKGAMSLIGMSAKAIQTASKVGRITNNFLVGATTGLEGSQLEAMGTFDDQMQTAREKIQAQIKKELYDYQRSINYNSNAAKLEIGNIYRQLKAQDNKRVARNSREGVTAFPMSDDILRNQAKQLYTNQLLANKQQQLQELHRKDELEAARAAEKAYATNFWMDYIKNIPLTVGIQKYKIAKGAMKSSFDNTLKKSLIADAETGGVKRNAIRYSSGKELGKTMAKQFIGGFGDEYLDGLNASFSTGVGNNEFDNYIKKAYDPKAYSSTVDTMLGNMLAGMSEGIDGITDRQNLYEGFIGAVSPIASTTVNHNAVFRPKDTWKALIGGKDSYGNKLNKAERLSTILMNPLLDTYVEAKEKDRNIDRSVEAINAVVAANKDKIQDASKIISVLGNYEGELNVGDTPYSILDSKDNKLHNAFTLLNVLGTLESMDGGTYTNLYKETMDTMEGLANGTLKKEQMDAEIDRFLADDNNKSLLEDADKDEEGNVKAKEFAAKKLQENAKYFMDMKERLDDIRNTFAYSSSLKNVKPEVRELLAYNIVAGEDYKKRLQGLEEELGVSSTDTDTLYKPDYNIRYGTPQARNGAVKGRERQIDKLQKEIDEHKKITDEAQRKEASLKEELKSTSDDNKIKEIEGSIKREQTSYQMNEFARKTLEEEKRKLTQEKDEISKITTDSDFNESTILNADARDRAWILDPKNRSNFSEGVQAIIDNVTSTLKQKNPDALDKVRDAGILAQRVEDMRNVYNKILDNNELATSYLEAVSDLRDRAALADALQRDIDNYYSEVGEAYVNKRQDPKRFKYAIINKSTDFLDAYIEDYPNQVDAIQPYYDIAKFDRIATAYINSSDASEEVKKEMQAILVTLNDTANTREELEKGLEEVIDSSEFSSTTRKRLDTLLDNMREYGYQRDATIVEERKKRKERREEEKKKKEEEKKKLDEEAKEAAEKKVKEQKERIPTSEDKERNSEEVDLGFDETTVPSKEEPVSQPEKVEPLREKKEDVEKKNIAKDVKRGLDLMLSTTNDTSEEGLAILSKYMPKNIVNMLLMSREKSLGSIWKERLNNMINDAENRGIKDIDKFKTAYEFMASYFGAKDAPKIMDYIDSPKASNTANDNDKNYREKIADLGILPMDESPAGGIHNNPKNGRESNLTSAQEKLIEKKVEKVLNNTDSTEENLHDAIVFEVNTGDRSSANATTLSTIYKVFDAFKQGKLTKDDVMNFIKEQFFGEKENPQRMALENSKNKKESTEHIDFDIIKVILANKYESLPETAKHKENADFVAHSAEKVEDNWYLIGNFAGSKGQTKVKAKKSIIDSITGQQTEDTAVQGNDALNNVEIIGDTAYGKSPSLEEQAAEVSSEGKEVKVSEVTDNVDNANKVGEDKVNTEETTLSGNTMSMYQPIPLKTKGIVIVKVGDDPHDTRTNYNGWMKDVNFNIQNIVDHELARIIKKNPHAKVKFMMVIPAHNATEDVRMQKNLMLVLDYDNKINKGITQIHDDSNGGVIESLGKKYLIIGVAGFGNNNLGKRALYDKLWNSKADGFRLKEKRKEFFEKHPKERFYVNEELSTEIVPYSQIPGYIVKQTLDDDAPGVRSVRELLADKKRNPLGYTMDNVAWGIQEASKFLIIGTSTDNVMIPRNPFGNLGSAFVLMPASNGKMVPSYLRVLKYTEMREGALKDKIMSLLQTSVSRNYDDSINAIIGLHNILYLDKEGDDILRRKTRNEVSLVHDGEIYKTFTLDDNFSMTDFLKAFGEVNPRINITARVLSNPSLLEEYDEAGALMTDAALFGTAGSSFSVYGLNSDGSMMAPEAPTNELAKTVSQSDFKNDKRQVLYNHQYYVEDNGVYSLDGETITDEKLIKQLDYNAMIRDGKLVPAISKRIYDTYILNGGENPQVIRVNRNTKEVKELSKKQSKEIVDEVNEQKAKEQREKDAQKSITSEDKAKLNEEKVESVDLGVGDFEVDPETGEIFQASDNTEDTKDTKEESSEDTSLTEEKTSPRDIHNETLESPNIEEHKMPTQKFTDLIKNKDYKIRIRKLLVSKWKDIPKNVSGMEKFLRDKNIEIDAIGTTKEDIEAWIRTIEDCR